MCVCVCGIDWRQQREGRKRGWWQRDKFENWSEWNISQQNGVTRVWSQLKNAFQKVLESKWDEEKLERLISKWPWGGFLWHWLIVIWFMSACFFEYRSRNWRSDSYAAVEAWVTTGNELKLAPIANLMPSQTHPSSPTPTLCESPGRVNAVPAFGLEVVMTLKDCRTQLFYQPYFWTHRLSCQGWGL